MTAMRCLCLALLLSPILLRAQETAPTPNVLSVDDTAAIQAAMGKAITVEGKVHSAFWVRGTVMLITFREEKTGFLAVVLGKNKVALNEAFGGDMAAALKGKTVRITGTVTEHNSRPQIEISTKDQIVFP